MLPPADRLQVLATALNVPTNSISKIWLDSVFSENSFIIMDSFTLLRHKNRDGVSEFTVISNEQAIATGILYEYDSFESVRIALLRQLVMNSMMLEMIIKPLQLKINYIGDFCILGKEPEEPNNQPLMVHTVFHFVRGAKAISLYGKNNLDVRAIAEKIDTLLKNPPASP